MKKITKEDLKEIFKQKYSHILFVSENKNIILKIIDDIVEELYNINEPIVYPLNTKYTYLFRKKYGIFDNGVCQTFDSIGEELGLTGSRIEQIHNKGLDTLIKSRIFNIKGAPLSKSKMSSADISDKENIKNIKLALLNITEYPFEILQRNNIITIKDLLTYSLQDLSRIISTQTIQKLHSIVNAYGLKFIDELSLEEKQTIVRNSKLETVMNSSISWISMDNYSHKKINDFYNLHNIATIKDLIEIINSNKLSSVIGKNNQDMTKIIKQTDKLHFTNQEETSKKEETLEEILKTNLLKVKELTPKTKLILQTNGITYIKDLIPKTTCEIQNMFGMTPHRCETIIKFFHGKGLTFSDENQKLELYSRTIYQELELSPKTYELLNQCYGLTLEENIATPKIKIRK